VGKLGARVGLNHGDAPQRRSIARRGRVDSLFRTLRVQCMPGTMPDPLSRRGFFQGRSLSAGWPHRARARYN